MKQAKFSMGQEVWAARGVGRWGEPNGYKGTVVGIQTSYTAGSYLYTVKVKAAPDKTVDLWEGDLSKMNDPNWECPLY